MKVHGEFLMTLNTGRVNVKRKGNSPHSFLLISHLLMIPERGDPGCRIFYPRYQSPLSILFVKSMFCFCSSPPLPGLLCLDLLLLYPCCCSSVAQSCLTLCNPMDCSTLGFPVSHHLLKFAQVHVHCIRDVVQPSHPIYQEMNKYR